MAENIERRLDVGESIARQYIHEQVARDMAALYKAFRPENEAQRADQKKTPASHKDGNGAR